MHPELKHYEHASGLGSQPVLLIADGFGRPRGLDCHINASTRTFPVEPTWGVQLSVALMPQCDLLDPPLSLLEPPLAPPDPVSAQPLSAPTLTRTAIPP